MKDIGPNRHLNKVLAGGLAVLAALPLYIGFNSMTFLPVDEWLFSAAPLAIGAVILALAIWVWRRPPINTAQLRFREGGFQLDTKQVFRGERHHDLGWVDIKEILHFNGGLYGGRSIRIITQSGSGPAWFASAWTDTAGLEIIARLTASAEAAGCTLEKEVGFWRGAVRDRWVVQKSHDGCSPR
ncbi:MAG: hypothetical protein AAF222_14570 [Pseudomonadota bacterium]